MREMSAEGKKNRCIKQADKVRNHSAHDARGLGENVICSPRRCLCVVENAENAKKKTRSAHLNVSPRGAAAAGAAVVAIVFSRRARSVGLRDRRGRGRKRGRESCSAASCASAVRERSQSRLCLRRVCEPLKRRQRGERGGGASEEEGSGRARGAS